MECSAINSGIEPSLIVVVLGDSLIAALPRCRSLLPLIHLNSSHESVGILYSRSEALIHNIIGVFCGPYDVNEIEVVSSINFFGVDRNTLFSCYINDLCECNQLLLVLPEEDQREWDHYNANNETSNAPVVAIAAIAGS